MINRFTVHSLETVVFNPCVKSARFTVKSNPRCVICEGMLLLSFRAVRGQTGCSRMRASNQTPRQPTS